LASAPAAPTAPAGGLLATVRGQYAAVETLRRALSRDRVHHAYLFDGPDGVGKERAAFGLAQALVCEKRGDGESDACGRCRACVRALPRDGEGRPAHPDVVVIERGLYDPATIGRRTPETQDISIDQIRTLVLARAAFAPTEGKAKVFIVRRAEELSQSAANALLKTLEEPGARTHFVLLSSFGASLLPTIQSRVQRVRFGPLGDSVLIDVLVGRGIAPDRAKELALLAGGSIAAALLFSDPEGAAQRDEMAERTLAAIASPDLGAALDVAEEAKKLGKEPIRPVLDAFAASLAMSGRRAATDDAQARRAEATAARYAQVLATQEQIDSNASVQLAIEAMLIKMRA
jgi:DNA polymerase-3 subunit delta'